MTKVIINRILNLDGTWQGYKLTPSNAQNTELNLTKLFILKQLKEIIN